VCDFVFYELLCNIAHQTIKHFVEKPFVGPTARCQDIAHSSKFTQNSKSKKNKFDMICQTWPARNITENVWRIINPRVQNQVIDWHQNAIRIFDLGNH